MTDIVSLPQFEKDFKKLHKKYTSLDRDLQLFKKALLTVLPDDTLPDTHRIPLGEDYSEDPIFKVRSFRCACLKKGSRSGIRVIYGYHPEKDIVTLIQIYHKSQTENHDEARIINFLRDSNST